MSFAHGPLFYQDTICIERFVNYKLNLANFEAFSKYSIHILSFTLCYNRIHSPCSALSHSVTSTLCHTLSYYIILSHAVNSVAHCHSQLLCPTLSHSHFCHTLSQYVNIVTLCYTLSTLSYSVIPQLSDFVKTPLHEMGLSGMLKKKFIFRTSQWCVLKTVRVLLLHVFHNYKCVCVITG